MSYKNVEMKIGEVCETAWFLAKKHWLWLALLTFLSSMASQLCSSGQQRITPEMYEKLFSGQFDRFAAMQAAAQGSVFSLGTILCFFLGMALSLFISMVIYRYLDQAVRGVEKVDLTELIKGSLNPFASFAGKVIVFYIVLVLGFMCCILPGLFLMVRLIFVPYLAANHPELTLSETFARSWEITQGRFWTLLGYGIVAVGIEIVGLCCCCVGIFFAAPLAYLMMAHVYMLLSGEYDAAECAE